MTAAQAGQFAVAARETGAVAVARRGVPARGLWVRVLGQLGIWRDGVSTGVVTPGQRAVLGLLAVSGGGLVHREVIVDALWGERPPATAVNLVQAYVSRLRRRLDPGRPTRGRGGLLVSAGASYRLEVTADELDFLAFGDLVTRARAARLRGDAAAACGCFAEALGLWQGEPLADVDLLRGHVVVAELARQQAAAVVEYAEVACASGRPHEVLPHLQALTWREPLNEKAHALLMIALAAGGQQAAALRVFADLRIRLDEQLGVYPGAVVAEAHARVLRQDLPPAAGPPEPVELARLAEPKRLSGRAGAGADAVVPRQLPGRVPHFVGRAAELAVLDGLVEQAWDGTGTVVCTISGPPGVGKTALAMHWAQEIAGHFPDGQLYVNLRGFDPAAPLSRSAAVRGFLGALGVSAERMPDGLQAQVGLYRSLAAERRLLIVLDSARDAAQVRPLLPGSAACMVLVTSRSELTALVATDGARPLRLETLNQVEAAQLLAGRIGSVRVAAEPGAAGDLIRLCGGLPLALNITAARAATHAGCTLAELAGELGVARRAPGARAPGDPAADVQAVVSWAYRHLSPASARMFRLLGVHPGPDISAAAAASLAAVPPAQARKTLSELTHAHLLAEQVPGRFSLHNLLRAYAARQAHTADTRCPPGDTTPRNPPASMDAASAAAVQNERRTAARRVLEHYLHTASAGALLLSPGHEPMTLHQLSPGVRPESLSGDRQALAWFEAEHEVLLAVTALAATMGFDRLAWQLPQAFGVFLDWRGHCGDWVAIQRTAVEGARRAADRQAQASAHRLLGRAYIRLRCYDEAGTQLAQARDLYAGSGDLAGQARTHLDVAVVLENLHHDEEALGNALQALRLFQAIGDDAGRARALNAAGRYHTLRGENRQARSYCGQALDLSGGLGDRHGAAAASDGLGTAHYHLGDYPQAVACYEHACNLYRALGDRTRLANSLNRIGDTRDASGDLEAACDAWRGALTLLEDLGHPAADEVRAKLGRIAVTIQQGPQPTLRA